MLEDSKYSKPKIQQPGSLFKIYFEFLFLESIVYSFLQLIFLGFSYIYDSAHPSTFQYVCIADICALCGVERQLTVFGEHFFDGDEQQFAKLLTNHASFTGLFTMCVGQLFGQTSLDKLPLFPERKVNKRLTSYLEFSKASGIPLLNSV